MSWKVLYYENSEGESALLDFLNKRSDREQAKFLNWINLLEEQGPQLPRPFADILEDGIHELRVKLSGDQVRAMYYFCYKDYIILTHAFIKRQSKVPKKEIKRAQQCRDDFLKRFPTVKKLKEAIDEKF